MTDKKASPDHPIHEHLVNRWSPYAFSDKPVEKTDLCSLFEAVRWAPSAYNEQPWRFIIATKDDPEQFQNMLSCLDEVNQVWACNAPVLVLSVVNLKFSANGKDNRVATHDLGLAAGNLCVEATSRGLFVHQMAGILPDRAQELYGIPEGSVAWTGLAIGHRGNVQELSELLRQRDQAPRQRKPLSEIVFSGRWGHSKSWS